MKKLETKNYKEILNILNFYKEIGVGLSIMQKQKKQKYKHFTQNKNIESHKPINKIIVNEENKAYNNAIRAKNIQELQDIFQNYDGCSLKKTATNFVKFKGNKNTNILIIDVTPSDDEDNVGKSF